MEQRRLGATGLWVSRLALGTMTWGRDTDEDDASSQLKSFVEAGGNLIDTADVYVEGESERVVGRLLQGVVRREDVVVATKAVSRRGQDRGRDASRRHLLTALDASLERLQTPYVDLWQLHAWDPLTPLEETLAALDTAVSSGRARYVGVSTSGQLKGSLDADDVTLPDEIRAALDDVSAPVVSYPEAWSRS